MQTRHEFLCIIVWAGTCLLKHLLTLAGPKINLYISNLHLKKKNFPETSAKLFSVSPFLPPSQVCRSRVRWVCALRLPSQIREAQKENSYLEEDFKKQDRVQGRKWGRGEMTAVDTILETWGGTVG